MDQKVECDENNVQLSVNAKLHLKPKEGQKCETNVQKEMIKVEENKQETSMFLNTLKRLIHN